MSSSPPPPVTSGGTPLWMQRKERGSFVLLRLMSRVSMLLGRRLTRPVIYLIALYFLLAAPAARHASAAYLARALGRKPGWSDLFANIMAFASTIHDRFYLLNGQDALFQIETIGDQPLLKYLQQGGGALLFGAHLGSFEVLLAHSRKTGLKASLAMYPENARQLNRALEAVNPNALAGIIPLGQMDSMLTLHQQLEEGALVGVLADRAAGPDKYIALPFLGSTAHFPTGPFRMAAMLNRPVYFMTGLYCGGNRYQVHFEPLAAPSETGRAGRDAVVRAMLEKYVAALERHCRSHPYNWFNFFDFWEPAQ